LNISPPSSSLNPLTFLSSYLSSFYVSPPILMTYSDVLLLFAVYNGMTST
jgi:hypothetical protein